MNPSALPLRLAALSQPVDGADRKWLGTQSSGAYDKAYAWVLVAGLLGLALNLCFHAVERRVLFWHPSQRADEAGGA